MENEWLENNAPGYNELNEKEKKALCDFAILWTLFEDKVLKNSANVEKIKEAVNSLEKKSKD